MQECRMPGAATKYQRTAQLPLLLAGHLNMARSRFGLLIVQNVAHRIDNALLQRAHCEVVVDGMVPCREHK